MLCPTRLAVAQCLRPVLRVPVRTQSHMEAHQQRINAQLPYGRVDLVDHNPYHTRGNVSELSPRVHPTVWCENYAAQARQGGLSQEDIETFNERGFLIVRQAFTPQEVDALREEVFTSKEEIEAQGQADRVTDQVPVVSEPHSHKLRSIFEVHKTLPLARRMTLDARLHDRAQQILNDEKGLYVHQSRVNFQQGFEGTGFSWHSDFETWHSEDGMPLPRCLSCVVMLTPNAAQNGSLMVVPGSHRTYMRCPGETPDKFWESSLKDKLTIGSPQHELLSEVVEESGGITYCEGQPGDVVMFDCNLLHGSHNNISPWPRTNIFFVYNGLSNRLVDPPYARAPRPEHIANRQHITPIHPRTGSILGALEE